MSETPYRETCGKCGARRVDSQIGLEASPDEFVSQLVDVFREVRRVLRDDGTLWLNLGDSYAGSWGNYGGKNRGAGEQRVIRKGSQIHNKAYDGKDKWRPPTSGKLGPGLKPKDLIGIPWRVAFALQADGWYLRQDIIWAKGNPMPESVTDRCTKAHEYLFLLSKRERYFYDGDAIKEQGSLQQSGKTQHKYNDSNPFNQTKAGLIKIRNTVYERVNRRSVWSIATQPYPEAHFATYPPELIKPCILAGSPAGGVVLDPFAGSGTTGKVALELGRSAVLIELNPEYVKLIEKRCIVNLPLMFDGGVAA